MLRQGDRVEFTDEGRKVVGDSRPGTVVTPYDGCDVVSVHHDDGQYTTTVFSWWLRKVREP